MVHEALRPLSEGRRPGFTPGARRPAGGHLRTRDQQGRLLRPGGAPLSPPSAHRLGEFRRSAAAARLRLHEARRAPRIRPGTRRSCCTTPRCACASGAATSNMPALARNADGDELLFVHAGRGELFCDYGHLSFEAGDYILIPRGTMWRVECARAAARAADRGHQQLLPAARQGPGRAARHLRRGHARHAAHRRCLPAISRTAPSGASPSSAATPSPPSPIRSIRSMRWAGTATCRVVRINMRDLRPLMSHRYHLPPSAHTTFLADRFVVCSFVPRPFETDPGAMKVPFFHNNDDYDEVHLLSRGQFLQPRQHSSRHDHAASGRLHARPASQGAARTCSSRRSPPPTNTR